MTIGEQIFAQFSQCAFSTRLIQYDIRYLFNSWMGIRRTETETTGFHAFDIVNIITNVSDFRPCQHRIRAPGLKSAKLILNVVLNCHIEFFRPCADYRILLLGKDKKLKPFTPEHFDTHAVASATVHGFGSILVNEDSVVGMNTIKISNKRLYSFHAATNPRAIVQLRKNLRHGPVIGRIDLDGKHFGWH